MRELMKLDNLFMILVGKEFLRLLITSQSKHKEVSFL